MSLNFAMHKQRVFDAFAKIGTSKNGTTAPPKSEDNRFFAAYEYLVADQLASIATKRKDQAKKMCEELGIISAPEEGTAQQVYDCELFTILAQTRSSSERIDTTALQNELIKLLGRDKALHIIKQCTTKTKPATIYTFGGK